MSEEENDQQAKEAFAKLQEGELNKAIDASSDLIKLKQCVCDLRSTGICAQEWWSNRVLPKFFVITICVGDKTYDM